MTSKQNIISNFIKNPIYQIIDWHSEDLTMEKLGYFNEMKSTEIAGNKLHKKLCKWWNWWKENSFDNRRQFIIYTFGRTSEGKSVSNQISGFYPYFYINIPDNWDDYEIEIFTEWILKNTWCKMYPMPKNLIDENSETIGDNNDRYCDLRWKVFYEWISSNFTTLEEFYEILGIIKMTSLYYMIFKNTEISSSFIPVA